MLPFNALSYIAMGLLAVTAVPTPKLARRGRDDSQCPIKASQGIVSVAIDGTVAKTIQVEFMGSGSFGCAYEIIGGWSVHGGNLRAVAKTPRLDKGGDLETTEVTALDAITELYAQGRDNNQREWAIIKYQDGKPIMQTAAWKAKFPSNYNTNPAGIDDCEQFLAQIYMNVAGKIKYYIETYGWDMDDINWNNFLFSDDLQTVNIIDWGHAEQADPAKADDIYWSYIEAFETSSMLPMRDTAGRKTNIQGICQSDMRDQAGDAFWNPLTA